MKNSEVSLQKPKVLHILRHAKSSWDNPALADIQRPLNTRGQKACKKLAEHLLKQGGLNTSNAVYCSPAERAQQTISGIIDALNLQTTWRTEPLLYTFNWQEIIQFCHGIDDEAGSVTIVGHNPALHEAVEFLAGVDIEKFPTCAYAKLSCNIARWQEMRSRCATLDAFLYPKRL